MIARSIQKLTPKKGRIRQATEWRPSFLTVLAKSANVSLAAKKAGISRQAAYHAYDCDEEFKSEWDSALEQACDLLEKEARRRALDQSDTLLIFLLKAHRPGKYREVIRTENKNLNVNANVDLKDFTLEDLKALIGKMANDGEELNL